MTETRNGASKTTSKIDDKNQIEEHYIFSQVFHRTSGVHVRETTIEKQFETRILKFFCSDDSRAIPRYPYNNPSHNTNAIEENTSWEEQSSLLRLTKASSTDAWPLGRTSAPAANRWRQKDLVPGTLAPGLRSPRKLEQVTNQALRRVSRGASRKQKNKERLALGERCAAEETGGPEPERYCGFTEETSRPARQRIERIGHALLAARKNLARQRTA
jgi:hypothetical protein